MTNYGKELVLDIHNCDPTKFTRRNIRNYFKKVCVLIDMERCKLCWWDDYRVPPELQQTEPHLKGTSAIQFIKTSNITIHTLDIMKRVYLNIFTCKDFDPEAAKQFTVDWFGGNIVAEHLIERI